MLGFLFQIERVLYWLSTANEEGIVGVEVEDDVVVQLQSGLDIETIYEQAKNTQLKNKTPFSDRSEDLWKTLSIWVDLILNHNIDPSKSIFSAISNRKIKNHQLIKKLSEASMDDVPNIVNLCSQLKSNASTLKGKLKKFGEVIINCDDEKLQQLINSIKVLDADYYHDQHFKKTIRQSLKIGDDLPFDYIYQSLLGFVSDLLINFWKEKKEAWIPVKSFWNRFTGLIAEYKSKKFVEKTADLLPVSSKEIKANKNKIFVRQLEAIGCDEDEILESIEHFFRAASEKSRYAKEGDVDYKMFDTYYEDLIENWKAVARPRFKATKNEKNKYASVGYSVFYETIRYKGKLNSKEPEQSYTHKGAYHFLSNDVRLGWHPEWEKMFKKRS